MAAMDQTKSGTVTVTGSSGSRQELKFWLAADFDLATYSTAFLCFVLIFKFRNYEINV